YTISTGHLSAHWCRRCRLSNLVSKTHRNDSARSILNNVLSFRKCYLSPRRSFSSIALLITSFAL
ncbi:AAEL006528-PA, partial [Aedes aegypti]